MVENKSISFNKDDKKVTVTIEQDIDRIGAADYIVRVYDDDRVPEKSDRVFCVQEIFSVPATAENKGKTDVIAAISEKNLAEANEYFNKEVQNYIDQGFKEVPTMTAKIIDKIENIKHKFNSFNKSDEPKLK